MIYIDVHQIKINEDRGKLFPQPSTKEYLVLKEDIKENGILKPIIVNKEHVVIDGHIRYQIAIELGLKEIPVIVREFKDEEEERAYIWSSNFLRRHLNPFQKVEIAYNMFADQIEAVGEEQEKDKTVKALAKKLILSYGTLQKGFKIKQYIVKNSDSEVKKKWDNAKDGRSNTSINKLLQQVKREEKQKENQDELQKLSFNYKETDDVEVHLGDFRDFCKGIPDNSIDLVVTDPPYLKQYLNLIEPFAKETSRTLKPGGFVAFYFWQQDRYEVETIFRKYLSFLRLIAINYKKRGRVDYFAGAVEHWKPILVFYKPPLELPTYYKDAILGEKGEKEFHEWAQSVSEARTIIQTFSKPGDLVLDPFAGSGTTLIAAMMENRRAIGIEINPEHITTIKAKIAQLKQEVNIANGNPNEAA